MAETNGGGRMDRIEGKMDAEREEAVRERKRLDQLWENTDKRIADLAAAIGQFVRK